MENVNQLAITGKEYVILYGPRVLGALVLLVLAWIVAGWAGGATRRGLRRAKVDDTLARFFGNLAKWVVLLAGILSILGIFGVETASFAGILAGAAFAVGMAFAGTLGNFAAGVLLLTFRPFKVGDVISAAGVTGKVEEIGLFATVLDTPDNRRMIVGNQSIVGSNIENITFHETRRVQVDVGTDYGADLEGLLGRAREADVRGQGPPGPGRHRHPVPADGRARRPGAGLTARLVASECPGGPASPAPVSVPREP